jgi:hypothetical protein
MGRCQRWNCATPAKMETPAGNRRFKRAMLELQRILVVMHSGTEQETGAWASGRFDLTCRVFPGEAERASKMSRGEAISAVREKYAKWHPDVTLAQTARLFRITMAEIQAARMKGGRA